MTLSLGLAGLWLLWTLVAARRAPATGQWPQVWGLIVLGIPLLGHVTYQNGPVVGLLALFGGAVLLRRLAAGPAPAEVAWSG